MRGSVVWGLQATWLLLLCAGALSSSTGRPTLGSACVGDADCRGGVVGDARCQRQRCACAPYHAQFNNTLCVAATMLGFECSVNQQCSLKVANSACVDGTCTCAVGFLHFRRHTCLKPARPGEVCYGDPHCYLADAASHCEFIIRNLLGRCRCDRGLSRGGRHEACKPSGGLVNSLEATGVASITEIQSLPNGNADDDSNRVLPVVPSSPASSNVVDMVVTSRPVHAPPPTTTRRDHVLVVATKPSLLASSSMTPFYENSLPEAVHLQPPFKPEAGVAKPELSVSDYDLVDEETTTERMTSTVKRAPIKESIFMGQLIAIAVTEKEVLDGRETTATNGMIPADSLASPATPSMDGQTTLDSMLEASEMLSTTSPPTDDFPWTPESSVTAARWSLLSSESPLATPTTPTSMHAQTDGDVASLGAACRSDVECQAADVASLCRAGRCDCAAGGNGTAECGADNTGCHPGTFQCRSSGACVSWFFVCDGRRDCADGSDEQCDETRGAHACPAQAFRCGDGACVSRAAVCDGVPDCRSGRDERGCARRAAHNHSCPAHAFRCNDGACLPGYEFCNAIVSCADGSDEPRETCAAALAAPDVGCPFRCANGRCRSTAVVCSGRDGCGDASDETRCAVCRCPAVIHPQPKVGARGRGH